MKLTKVLPLLLAILAVAACQSPARNSSTSPGTTTVMTPNEATTKLRGLLDDAFSAITPALDYREGWPHATENEVPEGTANVALDRYVMTRVSSGKYGALLGLVERHWKERGYTIESVNTDATMPAIFARTSDGSALSLRVGYPGNITIGADVNPIEAAPNPFGPAPSQPTLPNGNPDILPTLDDPFWSH